MGFTEITLGTICIIIALTIYDKIRITTCMLIILCIVLAHKHFSYSDNIYTPEIFEGSVSGNDTNSGSGVDTSGGDHSIFDEDMFSDVQVFDNKLIDNEVVEVGLENCIKNCEGVCIGHGISGRGLCFPSNWLPAPKNYDDGSNGSN